MSNVREYTFILAETDYGRVTTVDVRFDDDGKPIFRIPDGWTQISRPCRVKVPMLSDNEIRLNKINALSEYIELTKANFSIEIKRLEDLRQSLLAITYEEE